MPNVTVGSKGQKKFVPQWAIELQSLVLWVSFITARPPRKVNLPRGHSAQLPSKSKYPSWQAKTKYYIHFSQILQKGLSIFHFLLLMSALVDPRGTRDASPISVQFFSFSYSFLEHLVKIIDFPLYLWVWRPTSGKSWICHWSE